MSVKKMIKQISLMIAVYIFCISFVLVQSAGNKCGKYSTKMDQNVYSNHRLTSHVFESSSISRPLECYAKCLKNCACLSFNVCNSGKKCELNSEKKERNVPLYKQTDECDYYEYDYSQESASGDCVDTCCSTPPSQTCLNGGTCRASCMKNGKRFECSCPDGYSGDRCELVPRSCAAYAQSSNRTHGLRLIHAPDNSTYSAFCHFNPNVVLTLAMSYSRGNKAIFADWSLAKDYPRSEVTQNWADYRLSFARMQGLRDASTHWVFACSYPTRGLVSLDYVRSKIAVTDLLAYRYSELGDTCRLVEYANIQGVSCSNCKITLYQGLYIFHIQPHSVNCGGSLSINVLRCSPEVAAYYFGKYPCWDTSHHCVKAESSTTQFWFY